MAELIGEPQATAAGWKPSAIRLVHCLFLLSLCGGETSADYVVLKNGKRLNGVIRTESPNWVAIEFVGGMLTLDRKIIDRVEKQSTGENLLLSGQLALRKPDFLEAANVLKQSLKAGSDPALVRKAIVEASPNFLDRLAYVSSTEKKEWLSLCDDLTRSGSGDSDWAYVRGEIALAVADNGSALAAWRTLDDAYFAGHKKERDRVLRWALKRLSQGILERRLDESVAVLELLNVLDPERARSCRAMVTLQKAAATCDRGNVAEACRIYADELMPLAPEMSKVCLRVVIEPQCDLLCRRGAFDEAAALVRQCAKPHLPELAALLSARIYRSHIAHCLANGRWEMARGLLAEGSEFFDDADLEQLKHECQYAEQRSRVAPDDYGGHYKLGLELQEKKMNGAAIEEYLLASRSSELKEMAQKQIALIQEAEALDLLEKINVAYGEKQYVQVLDLVDNFRRRLPHSELSSKVDAIAKLAHQKVGEEARIAEALAMSRIEEARRLYYLGQINRAGELVEGVLRTQPTTSPVTIPAQKLRQEILKARLATGAATATTPEIKPTPSNAAPPAIIPGIDPQLLDQLNEDAFKKELQEILKQLEL